MLALTNKNYKTKELEYSVTGHQRSSWLSLPTQRRMMMSSIVSLDTDTSSAVTQIRFAADGWIPNNSRLPVIFYRSAISGVGVDQAAAFEMRFRQNGWEPRWRNGVYPFQHYHSTTHEVLGFAGGTAHLLIGGPNGYEVVVSAGDCVLLPAGTAHRRLDASADFLVVGAYPPDQNCDLRQSAMAEEAIERMAQLPFPNLDPIMGMSGLRLHYWKPAE